MSELIIRPIEEKERAKTPLNSPAAPSLAPKVLQKPLKNKETRN